MQNLIVIILLIIFHARFGQSNCETAQLAAEQDFANGEFEFHSIEFQPVENTYLYVLREDYNIHWSFVDSSDLLDYYNCYDSTLTVLLKTKFGSEFLNIATMKADSLEQTDNWKSDPQFPGGTNALTEYINQRLQFERTEIEGRIDTKVYVAFTIAVTGEPEDIEIFRGVNDSVNSKIITIFSEMPNWEPAYVYGNPTRIRVTYPLILR